MMCARSKRSETEGNIVPGFAHRPIAAVILRVQRHCRGFAALRASHAAGGVADFALERWTDDGNCGLIIRRLNDKKVPADFRVAEKVCGDLAMNAGFVLEALGRGPFAIIIVARKARITRQMRIMYPVLVILRSVAIGSLQPCAVFVDYQNRSEEHTSELQSRRDLVCRLLLE